MHGRSLLVVLAILNSSCRKDVPPAIEICIADGSGGADCEGADGRKYSKLPTDLTNYWMTNENDMRKFSQWCFDTSVK